MDKELNDLIQQLNIEPRIYSQDAFIYLRDHSLTKEDVERNLRDLNEGLTKKDHPIILALLDYVKSRLDYYDDIRKALFCIEDAIKNLETVENYKRLDLYYSLLCSKSIFLNLLSRYSESYMITSNAINELSKTNNISTQCVFSINLSYIFNELRYPDFALETLNSYRENRRYLTTYARLHLSKAFLTTFALLHNYDSYFEEIGVLCEYTQDKKVIDSALLEYYVARHDMANAQKIKNELLKNIDYKLDVNLYPDACLAVARFHFFMSDFTSAYKIYDSIYNHIELYTGHRLEIIHEYIKVLYRLNKNIEAFEAYEKFYEEEEYHRKIMSSIILNNKNTDYSLLRKNYNETVIRMDLVTSFYNEAIRTNDLVTLTKDFFNVTEKFFPGSNVKPIFKKKDGLYALDGDDIVKILAPNRLDIFNIKTFNHVPSLLQQFIQGYGYVYTCKVKNEILGYVLMDNTFINYQDDTSKALAMDVANSLFKAQKNMESIDKLKTLTNIDPLTQAYNRSGLDKYLKTLSYHNTYLIELDIDNFKLVNDTYGHPAGDEVLKHLTSTLRKFFRRDEIFRVGGEEFIVISNQTKEEIQYKFESIKNILKTTPTKYENKDINITISYGGVIINNYKDFKKAYQKADMYLYNMKQNGKDNGYLE